MDKTALALNLIKIPGRFFLSRPRRFGKSLFVDTLKEIFEGNEQLFRGLYIHDKWDWDRKFPVIKIDFAGGVRTFTRRQRCIFALKIPNMEVRLALNDWFINAYAGMVNEKNEVQNILSEVMQQGEPGAVVEAIKRLFAGIPWRNFTNNDLADFEVGEIRPQKDFVRTDPAQAAG